MPSTPKYAIRYPDGSSSFTPLQDQFANLANDVESALISGLGGAPRQASSDVQRNLLFPSPQQGNTVNRPDKGYTEQYYALYNSGTNPSGRSPAGWYPQTIAWSHLELTSSVASQVTNTVTPVGTFTVDAGRSTDLSIATLTGSGKLTLPFVGIYSLMMQANFTVATGGRAFIEAQVTPPGATSATIWRNGIMPGEDTGLLTVSNLYVSTANTVIQLNGFSVTTTPAAFRVILNRKA